MSSQQQMSACIDYMADRISISLIGKTFKQAGDKFLRSFNDEATRAQIEEYIREPEIKCMVCYVEGGDKLQVLFPSQSSVHSRTAVKKKGVYFLKSNAINDALKLDDIAYTNTNQHTNVSVGEISENTLTNLSLVASEIYFPLLQNPSNRAGWSGLTARDVMLKFSQFLSALTIVCGQIAGQTVLPYPPAEAFDDDNLVEKDRVHILETCIIQWSNKINLVIQTDPMQNLLIDNANANAKAAATAADGDGQAADELDNEDVHDSPESEVAFWAAKIVDLTSLQAQLSHERMNIIVDVLTELKSPFASQIGKLKNDVIQCKAECVEIHRYLQTLKPYFSRISEELEFARLKAVFVPLHHTILLVCTKSAVFNSKKRISCLMSELSNSVVYKAQSNVSGELLFRLIEDENMSEAISTLQKTIEICHYFITVFKSYQAKARTVLQGDVWDINDKVVFSRLHTFIDRCNEMYEFTKIVFEFSKLEKIYISGTKGKQLTAALRVIHTNFNGSVEAFKKANVSTDCMNVQNTLFDDLYYNWRLNVKTLEKRLAAVLMQAFDDQSTLQARFKLLDSFEGLLDRPIVADEIERKQAAWLQQYIDDIKHVSQEFHAQKSSPKIDVNQPPIAGALLWCRGLLDRINEPYTKFKFYTAQRPTGVNASTGAKAQPTEVAEIDRLYASLVQQLQTYEQGKISEWSAEIEQTSDEKLKQCLLKRDKDTRLLSVNFDHALIRLLREVKYFLLLKLDVAETALSIYKHSDLYRQQIGQLEQMVSMYNEMLQTLHIVERPLVDKEMALIDDILEQGLYTLNWKSEGVNQFIQQALSNVTNVYGQVTVMKDNMSQIKKTMNDYSQQLLIERKNKPMSPIDFDEMLRKLWVVRHQQVADIQDTVTKLLLATNQALKANRGSPIWRSYVEYVQDHIRDGLASTIVNSIKYLCEQLDHQNIEKSGIAPMLEIKLGLYANDVLFNADDNQQANATTTTAQAVSASDALLGVSEAGGKSQRKSRRDVWQIINDWVEQMFEIGNIMTRADGSHYVSDLKKNEQIVKYINTLKRHLDHNQKECEVMRQEYIKYEYLWKTDRNIEFNRFLQQCNTEATSDSPAGEQQQNAQTQAADADDHDAVNEMQEPKVELLPLEKFEAKVLVYKELQSEVGDKRTTSEVGWLKVNSIPIKSALNTWINRWINTYTSYLFQDVSKKLVQLDTLMNDVNNGLLVEVTEGDSVALKQVLGYIHAVRSKEKYVTKLFQPLRDTTSLLKKYGRQLDEMETKLLAELPMKWESCVNHVYKVKETVNVLQNKEVDKIKAKVDAFDSELKQFRAHFKATAPFDFDETVADAYNSIYEFSHQLNVLEQNAYKLNDLEKVFELSVSKHRSIKKCRLESRLLKQCWDMVAYVKHQFDDWKKTVWDKIDTELLLVQCKKLLKQIESMPSEVHSYDVYQGLVAEVKNLLTVLPLVNLLHSPAMEDRHWRELKIATHKTFNKDSNFCLNSLLELQLHKYVSEVEYIVELASKESKISTQLNKIETQWNKLELEFGVNKSGIALIQRPDEILVYLEENMLVLQSMQGQGKYIEHFAVSVNKWQKSLNQVESVLTDWLDVQSKWNSLQAIFLGSKDIRVQLPEDSTRFDEIDSQWKNLMSNATSTPNVIDACSKQGRSELLGTMKNGLEMCEKALYQYLETKRKLFPRFYFLSNQALLDILSNGHDPSAIQKHLGDCFDNIARLEFEADPSDVDGVQHKAVGMYSKDGDEYVAFQEPFMCVGAVEDWLLRLVGHMRVTLRDVMSKAKFTADHWEIEKPRHKWLFDYPAQVALTVSQIIWTEEVNSQFDAFADGNEQAMKDYSKVMAQRLEQLILLVLGNLNLCDRIKIMTLITVDCHNRDVVQKLIDTKTMDATAFQWQSQMRYQYINDSKNVLIKVADATFEYQNEYVGNTGRLVITPLTDRCYITLTQALRLIMGGAPAGPAGTGKTETTKDLGRALGLPVYVFNCSEQMNVSSLGAIFKGLAQTGAWGCFDEFNRIPIEVLSVVSSQVNSILNAIREKRSEFDFMGEIIKMEPTVGMFITMNPGYAGRTELPENLKTLFRSCAMVVPDMRLICENMLMSEGFMNSQRLSNKFVTLYSLSSELLSKQAHYDWGLRATKAVLRVAGALKRAEPKVDEDRILMRALRDFNIPKLIDDDKPIFRELISDLFPGLANTERKFDKKLQEAIVIVARQRGLQADDVFVLKCVEMAELLEIRHSVFVIGPAGSGKSEIWRTLLAAYKHLGHKTAYEVINPKAVRNDELYGWLSKTDWHDGIMSTIMRNMSKNRNQYTDDMKCKWMVLDGDIDPNWIESLNSVMDDNKVLTLVSNERIPLTSNMRMIFEISNLDNATPATVSRAGILFINAKDVGSKPFLDSWIERRDSDKERSSLLALFNKYCTPEYMHEMQALFQRVVPLSEINLIRTLCHLLEGLLARIADERRTARQDEKQDLNSEKEQFESNFVFACIWAFGGATLTDKSVDHRKEFSDWWRRVFTTVKFPKEGTVFDYYPEPRTGKMVAWADVVPKYEPADDSFLVSKVFVPTVDTVCQQYIMNILVPHQKSFMLVGTGGTGKTVIINQYLRNMAEQYMYCNVNLNYYTDAKALQRVLEQPIDKRSGRNFGPPGNKKLVYFVDDLNMPRVDAFGTQSPSCLLKQQMNYGSWYDVQKLERKEIQDVQYVAAMNPTAGSFTIDPRLQGLFATFTSTLPNKKNLTHIYHTVLTHHLNQFNVGIQGLCGNLVKATIELHDSVGLKFIPSSKKFHYQFNLRELSNIFQGMCLAVPDANYTPKQYVQLWQHECNRVFSDRLTDAADITLFEQMLEGKTKLYFKEIFRATATAEGDKKPVETNDATNQLLFASFCSPTAGVSMYSKVDSIDTLKTTLQQKLHAYNDSNPVMNLELFDIAAEHVARIVRIIENPRGNALLVGVGGSGKQSLAKLASSICGYDVFQISVSQTYSLNDFKADLQALYLKAGLKNIPITFILADTQIVSDEWLVYVNDLLSSGYIPELFTAEDKDNIVNQCRNEAKQHGVVDSRETIFEYFINNVRTNLHVVLCFSPVGEQFRVRCRKFPALISCTTVDWFHAWPRDALISVAKRFLQDIDVGSADMRAQLAEHMAHVHLTVNDASTQYALYERRYNYTTPKSFLELIAMYKVLLTRKRTELAKQKNRLEKGIQTLKSTHAQVAVLKDDLTVTLVKVNEKGDNAAVLINKMGVERKKVEEQQTIASIEATKAKSVSEIANKIASECEADLAAALPLLERAKEAVDCLSKQSLTTLKSFATPPNQVMQVTTAVLILKNVPGKKDWAAAKKMMKDVGKFQEELKSFDATSIDDGVLVKLKPLLELDYFNFDEMTKFSEAAANLCRWLVSIVDYNGIYKNVAPKVAAQKKAAEEYDQAQQRLQLVEEKVAAMQLKLKTVTDSLKLATDEKNQVEGEAQNCQDRLALAKRLVDGLHDENVRWNKSITQFELRENTLIGDTMLAAAFVSYIGAFNQKYRQQLWQQQWTPDLIARNIPLTQNVDPLYVLANESDFAKWKNDGLAADRISLENGAIITQCTRWPLIIDPQLQGVKWIRNRVKELKSIQLNQKRWLQTLTQAIEYGSSTLIEAVGEELDATLDPVLSRQFIQRGSSKLLKLGAEEVVYDDNFHLYIQTKITNPHYKPEIAAQCTLVNFMVTEEGLEEQLLALVVNHEKPELEEKRTGLVRAINDYMVSLTDLENELLERLSNAPDDVLSDVSLIEGLERTKQASLEIEQKVELAKKQEIAINAARNEFRSVAAEASWIYFLLIQLSLIDHMYQYSLDAFTVFFTKAMLKAKKSDVTVERVKNLRESIRQTIFTWVNRGLFEKHKLIFSTQLTFKLMQKNALDNVSQSKRSNQDSIQIDQTHYDYLIRGSKKFGVDKPSSLDWLPAQCWFAVQKLIELDGFQKLAVDMQASPNRFKEWYCKTRPESTPLPLEWRKLDELNPFAKLLIVRSMRPDRMTIAMENFVATTLPNGTQYTECDAGKSFNDVLMSSLDDSTPTNPIFFILSPGADPIASVELLAKRNGVLETKFHRVALGEGQDVVAMNRLEIGHREGHWVVLENIHLMPLWTLELEKRLDEYAVQKSHADFRVFLSAEPSTSIPIGLLERSIKLTNEPPQGLKQNIKRAFASFEKEEFEFKDPKIKSILFGLCHFHSIIIERIKFGSKGWNRAYPFNTGDLMCSSIVLANYLESQSGGASDKIPWADLRYIFGEILYGGHITDDWDRGLASSYLDFYMRDELLDEMELFPYNESFPEEKFRSPPVLPYDQYFEYIDTELKAETPVAFGLHPNAEIAVKTKQATELFQAILDLQPRQTGGGGSGGNASVENMQSPYVIVQMLIAQILNDKSRGIDGIAFNLDDLSTAIVDERGPFQNVFMLECDRMNILIAEIRRSLKELDLGLSGELQMSERMESLFNALHLNRVPATWARLAYPSQRSLASWMDNLLQRAAQLQTWVEEPTQIPPVTNIALLFNPQSFLTAIMQKTAQKAKLELDKLVISCDVTRKTPDQVDSRARDGAYVTGLYLEGARWNWTSGGMEECLPREMASQLPVVCCKAVLADKLDKNGVYRCPVYKTQQRGPTFVFTAGLRTKLPAQKWNLAGVACVMEVED